MDSVPSSPTAGTTATAQLEQGCTTRRVFDLVADKWMLSILCVLSEGTVRYNALQRAVVGITPKVLTHHLRSLEADGLVTRTVHPVIPPHVDYDLTDLGRSLRQALQPLLAWGESHLDEVERARSGRQR
ncbi:helix-turn-helix domain-containing protein [Kitasatospora sp. NPDC096128]|uniref:winged helix-turn-helix transcriptional regulator n=1 Tax=Kitasatospora sp. NPDC096128 TaxID=3155547 RepID=UPI003316B387